MTASCVASCGIAARPQVILLTMSSIAVVTAAFFCSSSASGCGEANREVHAHLRPPRVEYSLTDLGRSVTAPLAAIRDWSERHLPDVRAARRRFEQLQHA